MTGRGAGGVARGPCETARVLTYLTRRAARNVTPTGRGWGGSPIAKGGQCLAWQQVFSRVSWSLLLRADASSANVLQWLRPARKQPTGATRLCGNMRAARVATRFHMPSRDYLRFTRYQSADWVSRVHLVYAKWRGISCGCIFELGQVEKELDLVYVACRNTNVFHILMRK